MTRLKIFDASLSGTRLDGMLRNTTICEYRGDLNSNGTLKDYSRYNFHMNPLGTQYDKRIIGLQYQNGNACQALYFNGTNTAFQTTIDSNLNTFDQDHTITIVGMFNENAAQKTLLTTRKTSTVGGCRIWANGLSLMTTYHDNNWAEKSTGGLNCTLDMPFVYQVVRSSNIATAYLNGTASTSTTDLTGYGYDVSDTLKLGYFDSYFHNGLILYVRVDRAALSVTELANDRGALLGTLTHIDAIGKSNPSVTLAVNTAMKVESSTKQLFSAIPNSVTVCGPGGGMFAANGPGNTRLLYSEDFSNAAWTKAGTASVNTNQIVAPDGTTTMDLLSFGTTGNEIYQSVTGYSSNGNEINPSFYIKRYTTTGTFNIYNAADATKGTWTINCALLPDETIRIWRGNIDLYGSVTSEWLGTAAGAAGLGFVSNSGTIQAYIWGANLPLRDPLYPYLKTTSSTAGINSTYLPVSNVFTNYGLIGTTETYKKLYISFDYKAAWKEHTSQDTGLLSLIEIHDTGSQNRLRIYATIDTHLVEIQYYGTDSVTRYPFPTVTVENINEWHRYECKVDFVDRRNGYFKVDSTISTTGSTYTAHSIDLRSRIMYIGGATGKAYGQIKNVKIWVET